MNFLSHGQRAPIHRGPARAWSSCFLPAGRTKFSCSTAKSGGVTVAQALLPVPSASAPKMYKEKRKS